MKVNKETKEALDAIHNALLKTINFIHDNSRIVKFLEGVYEYQDEYPGLNESSYRTIKVREKRNNS